MLIAQSIENEWLSSNMDELSQAMEGLDYYVVMPKRTEDNQAVLLFDAWLKQQSKMKTDNIV